MLDKFTHSQAEAVFERICPGEEFLPQPPNPGDLIFQANPGEGEGEGEGVGEGEGEGEGEAEEEVEGEGTSQPTEREVPGGDGITEEEGESPQNQPEESP